jgi:hypothetical protein
MRGIIFSLMEIDKQAILRPIIILQVIETLH